jgi:UDP-N-acetylglucosamine acyltransferase
LDAPPFSLVAGDRARLAGLNSVGLRRQGASRDTIRQLKRAFRIIFGSKLRLTEAVMRVQDELSGVPEVERLVGFLQASERGFCR